MALQDLTPQLRTRMSRVERVVGLFVVLAALLMVAGFAYYLIHTGRKRGWFVNKVPYYCYTKDATGLKPGDTVRLLGRNIGRIVEVETMPLDPWFTENHYNVFVKFDVWEPHFGYIYTDSIVRIISTDFFGARSVEITPGDQSTGTVTVIDKERWEDTTVLDPKGTNDYILLAKVDKGVWLRNTDEAPAMFEHVDGIVRTLAQSLPNITRRLDEVLAQATQASSNANLALTQLQPTLGNLQTASARLGSEDGAIGRMLLSTNLQGQVEDTLVNMAATLTNTTALIRASEVQLHDLTRRVGMTLDTVSLITSNLNAQLAANGLFLGEVSSLVVNADDMVQGLKRHWLLRSSFNSQTNAPLDSTVLPSLDGPSR